MIIDFTVTNYRSIKNPITLSMEASGAKGKPDNVAEIILKNGKVFRLLKTAVIYGANASGKSNIIRAFWTLHHLISTSYKYDASAKLGLAEPFELDVSAKDQPTQFNLNFIYDGVQYIYYVSFNKDGIIEETLKHYPETRLELIYKREGRNFKPGQAYLEKLKKEFVNPKRLVLSEIGNEGDPFWEELMLYLTVGNGVLNLAASNMVNRMPNNAKWFYDNPEHVELSRKLERLIQLSDLGIRSIGLKEEEIPINDQLTANEEQETYTGTKKQKRFKTYHDLYDKDKLIGKAELDLVKQASTGTQFFIGIGAEVLITLDIDKGRTLWLDEFDNSLHPYLCRFIINLFHHPKSNPHNAQLIIATHETTLLDKGNFRKDQIWITQKDKFGCTSLYSVDDIDMKGLRDDIPFDKWYMSGKFGGLPHIKELEFIFSNEKENPDGKKE